MINKELAVVISPHIDDAVISLGDVLRGYSKVIVLNVFNRSGETITGVPLDLVNAHRISEDTAIAKKYGFEFQYANLPDTSLRGVSWNDYQAPVDFGILEDVQNWIKQQIDSIEGDFEIFIPAAYGLHPDHYIATLTFATDPLLYYLKWIPFNVYCEQPYYIDPQLSTYRHEGHDYLDQVGKLVIAPFDADVKIQMLSKYGSQLSDERIDFLAKRNKNEYFWETDSIFFVKSMQRGKHG